MDLLELNKANQGGPGGPALLTLISEKIKKKKKRYLYLCVPLWSCGLLSPAVVVKPILENWRCKIQSLCQFLRQ